MPTTSRFPAQNKFSLAFTDAKLEQSYRTSCDKSVRIPLRHGIIISILSWYSAIGLIYFIIPEQFNWLAPLTILYIGSYFGFIIFASYRRKFRGYYHFMGAISNLWAGLYAIYFCHQFPSGTNLTLSVLIFIIFFGSYLVRLRWIAGFFAAFTYILAYNIYLGLNDDFTSEQVMLYSFVSWMTLVFAVIAGRVVEMNSRTSYIQRRIISEQNAIIEKEKQVLLQEVHHRVKNNLQIIISLINLELSKEDKDQLLEAMRSTQSRVMAMALVHQRMKQTSDFTRIALPEFTNQLIANSKSFHQEHPFNFELDIPPAAAVDIETAIPLGLIMNELLSNFFKYCTNDGGKAFIVKVKQTKGNHFTIRFSDNGLGFPNEVLDDLSQTLGLELIQILADQIDGEFTYFNDNGAVCEISFVSGNY